LTLMGREIKRLRPYLTRCNGHRPQAHMPLCHCCEESHVQGKIQKGKGSGGSFESGAEVLVFKWRNDLPHELPASNQFYPFRCGEGLSCRAIWRGLKKSVLRAGFGGVRNSPKRGLKEGRSSGTVSSARNAEVWTPRIKRGPGKHPQR